MQSAFFEAERSTKTDETTDTVVAQSDMKKNKTKDQTIPVFAEDGDGVRNPSSFTEVWKSNTLHTFIWCLQFGNLFD